MFKYPSWLHFTDKTLMDLPEEYQEFFIRWYYYNNTDETKIPATVPVENIEDYIVEHLNEPLLWESKGFAIARDTVDVNGDNLSFLSDPRFAMIVHYVAKLWYKAEIENDWIKEDITKEEFQEQCHIIGKIRL
jgi:hypothetical protein